MSVLVAEGSDHWEEVPRDDQGRWTSGGGGDGAGGLGATHPMEALSRAQQLEGGAAAPPAETGSAATNPPLGVRRVEARLGVDMSPDAIQARMEEHVQASIAGGTFEADSKWFNVQHDAIGEQAAKLNMDPNTFAGEVAALSPRTPWEQNMQLAATAHGISTTWSDIPTSDLAQESESPQMLRNNLENALQIDRGAPIGEVLNSPKTASFYNNLAYPDDPSSVTFDSWMARAATGEADLSQQNYDALRRGASYGYMTDQVRSLASKYSVTPPQMQSVIWSQIRGVHL